MKNALVVGAAGTGLAIVLTGCGAGGATAAQDVAQAVDLGELLLATETQAQETGSARFSLEVDAAGQEIAADGVIAYGPDGQALEATYSMPMPDGSEGAFTMRIVDGGLYMSAPELFGSEQWVDFSAAGDLLGDQFGDLLGQLEDAGDPTAGLEQLEPYADIVEEGSESVDGVETTRYRLEIDVADLAGIDAFAGPYDGLGVDDELDVTLWVADDQTLRKVESAMTIGGQDATVSMRYFDYGIDVAVEAPSADQLVDLGALGLGDLSS